MTSPARRSALSSDIHLMARFLAAISTGEGKAPFDTALVDPAVLRCTVAERDRMALKLRKSGYVDGPFVIDGIGFGAASI